MSTEVLRSINLDNMNIYERRLHAFHIISVLFAHTVCSLKALKGREVGKLLMIILVIEILGKPLGHISRLVQNISSMTN